MGRLSVPSYIIPGTYLENIRFIDQLPEVRNIELLFFIFDLEVVKLFREEKEGIERYRDRFSFTVHMPDILSDEHQKFIDITRDIAKHYVIHPPESDYNEFARLVQSWISRYGDIFVLENLARRNFEFALGMVDGLSICCDSGHLLLQGNSPGAFLETWGDRVREIHLHGIHDGMDHCSFKPEDPWFLDMIPLLREYHHTLNVEVFDYKTMREIVDILSTLNLLQE